MPRKNFLVTGAGRGIGRGLSRLLLNAGHRVLLADNDSSELAHTTSTLLSAAHTLNSDFLSIHADLRNPSDIHALASAAATFFSGRLDVLIHNAAATSAVGATPFFSLPLDEWNASLQTNLTAPFLLSQLCLPLLFAAASPSLPSVALTSEATESTLEGGGVGIGDDDAGPCIIHMSSTRAVMSEPDNEAYAATKAGLLGLTQSMAVSFGGKGLRVNAILPGWIHVGNECKRADEEGQTWADGLREEDHAWQLTGRVGRVEDVYRAVMYLVENGGVTGAEVVVDGGVTRRMVYPE